MSIGDLTKKKAHRVIGLDSSTKSLAFGIIEGDKAIRCGEIKFVGANVFERLKDAKSKVKAMVASGDLVADYIGIESTIMVRNHQTAIDMAYINGVIIGELMVGNAEVHKLAPIQWQAGIGNPNLTAKEKAQIRIDFPNKSDTWYREKGREIRKARTMDIARNYFTIADGSDNISDAVGIALHITNSLTRT